MPSNYPNVVDAWTNPSSGTLMNAPGFEHDVAHANVYDAIEKIEAELSTNPRGNYISVKARIAALQRAGVLTVASSTLAETDQWACDYACDGIDDQVQINNALKRASRINDGFSGAEGWIGVALVGETFNVGANNDPITMYPNTTLSGAGAGTLIKSDFGGGSTKGVIEVVNANVHRCEISDLAIGTTDYFAFNGSGIKLVTNDTGQTYEMFSGNDNFIKIHRVNVFNAQERGIWLQGGREIQIDNCHIQNARKQGLFVDSHTDAKIHRIVANGNSGTEAGIELSSAGNSQITDCKVFYRGNGSSNVNAPGFRINSSRITIANCQAQDNGGYGFIFEGTGGDHTATNLLADSNSARGSVTGGFYIEVPGVYSAMHALDRNQSTQRQTRGFVFGIYTPYTPDDYPKVYLTGRGQTPAGTSIVVNNPHADSYVRLLREGSSLYSVG
jgi:hypothetical protein